MSFVHDLGFSIVRDCFRAAVHAISIRIVFFSFFAHSFSFICFIFRLRFAFCPGIFVGVWKVKIIDRATWGGQKTKYNTIDPSGGVITD